MVTTILGTPGTNGTNGHPATAGTNGGNASFSQNGVIHADSITVKATGGKGGKGGKGTGPTADGADGGNGGKATINFNGNIFDTPATKNVKVVLTSTGGDAGLGGASAHGAPGEQGTGGSATVSMNGNIIQPHKVMTAITLDASAIGGKGAIYGDATATLNGNIVQPSKANTVILSASAFAKGSDDDVSFDGDPTFGTKKATVNGNIVQGDIGTVTLSADTGPSNGTANLNGNIVQITNLNRTGTVTMEASGNHITITNNKIHLGKQELDLTINTYAPYESSIVGNEFYGTGDNTFQFSDYASPGPHSDTVVVDLAAETFTFNGDDNILSGFANVTLQGDISFTLTGDDNDNILIGGDGDDVIYGLGGNDKIYGNGGNDQLFGGDGDDQLFGGDDDDILDGGDGNDLLNGGLGNDTASYQDALGGVTVSLGIVGPQDTIGAGIDTLTGIENLTGSDFDDTLEGDAGDNILHGGDGDDILVVTGGTDILDGDADPLGNTADFRNATSGVTVNLTTAGQQDFTANGLGLVTLLNIQSLTGSDFNDTLTGDANANMLSGGALADTLKGGAGDDILDGGLGVDTADYSDETMDGLTVNLLLGTSSGPTTGNDTLSGIENVTGSGFADILIGDATNNVLNGGGGDDVLRGGVGNDTLTGGGGNDTADFSDATMSGLTVDLGAGTSTGGGLGNDTLSSIENITGSNFDDTLTGNGGANLILGGGGIDVISGAGGIDTIYGGIGNDNLTGGAGDDILYGEGDDDTLNGGNNNDTLYGGNGADTLNGQNDNDTLYGDAGNDTLKGGNGDDIITGGAGDDSIDGGSGYDTAVFSGPTVFSWNGMSIVATGPDGTDTLTGIEAIDDGGGTTLLVGAGGYATINDAIAAANPGDTILIAPGEYDENVVVDKGLTLIGLGNPGEVVIHGTFADDNPAWDPNTQDLNEFLRTGAYSGNAGNGIEVTADGVTLQNLTVEDFLNAVSVSGASVAGLTLGDMTLQHNVFGFTKPDGTAINGLTIDGGQIIDGYIGVYFYNDDPLQAGTSDATDSTITGTTFQDITQKGIYIETAQGTTLIDGITMTNVGEYGGGTAFGAQGKNGAGIDSNLKFNTYSGTLTITGFNFTDVGSSTGGGLFPLGHFNAAGIVLNGRDDPTNPVYSVYPADVSGLTILVSDGSIDGTSTGIRAGEAGKANPSLNVTGPAVTISDVDITNYLANADHDQIDNHTNSLMTVLGTGGNDTYHSAATSVSTGPISFYGFGGADDFRGGLGNDTFVGGTGNDTLDGGAGTDVAYYAGRESEYTAASLAAVTGGPDGDDTLSNIERLKFLSPSHVSDVDNNGFGDIVFQNTTNGDLVVNTLAMGVPPDPVVSGSSIVTGVGVDWKAVSTGQFTADFNRDSSLLLQNTTTQDLEIIVDSNLTGGGAATPFFMTSPGAGWMAVDVGDFNGDATSDVLLQNGAQAEIVFTGGLPGMVLGAPALVTTPAGMTAISSGDFDGNGKSDILWQNTGTGDIQVSLMNGATTVDSATFSPGAGFTAIGTGDFDNDGKSDILFESGGNAVIWTMDGTTHLNTYMVSPPPYAGTWAVVGAEDANNDGFSDIIWHDTSAGSGRAVLMDMGGMIVNPGFDLAAPAPATDFRLVASTGGG